MKDWLENYKLDGDRLLRDSECYIIITGNMNVALILPATIL